MQTQEGPVPGLEARTTSKALADLIGTTIQVYSGRDEANSRIAQKEFVESKRLKADRDKIRPAMVYIGTIDLITLVCANCASDITRPDRRDGWEECIIETKAPIRP